MRQSSSLGLFLLLAAMQIPAQEVPTILQVDVENYVAYTGDVTDPSVVAKSPTQVTPNPSTNFYSNVILADVTAINGTPAKGVMVIRSQTLLLTPTPAPGAAISDVTRVTYSDLSWEFLKADGSQIGNIYAMGLSGGVPPPGSALGATSGGVAIVGGTGAFTGARGTTNSVEVTSARGTSEAEDPSRRRANGGGRARFVFQLFPMFRPEVVVGADGPQVLHSDNTTVSTDRPAKPAEDLVLIATGLGPTKPGVNIGDPFPSDALATTTSPIEVVVNGNSSPAAKAYGAPGSTNTYRVEFRVPDDAPAGMMTVQISAAWTRGQEVLVPVSR